MALRDLVVLARPQHWIKNSIVLFPVVFAKRMGDAAAWLQVGVAAAAFCFASSAVYVINDIRDRYQDRDHPLKKDRPLASGRITPKTAIAEAVLLAAMALVISLGANVLVLVSVIAYFVLQAAYTFRLKRKMIVDVICVALGFVLRAGAGALAIRVAVSPWLVVCTFTICLFMGFCKRRNEIGTIGAAEVAARHRRTLIVYTPELLTHLITLSAAIAIVSYLLYATSPRTIDHFGTGYLVYTLPLVVYGICRFAMLSMKATYEEPTDLILHDRPFQAAVGLWLAAVLAIIVWGKNLQGWLESLY